MYKKRLKRNIALFYPMAFLSGISFIVPIWVSFDRRILTFTQIGLVVAFAYAVSIIFELPTGALADIIGRKKTILLGTLIVALGFGLISYATNPISFFIATFFISTGSAFISGADTAITYDTFKELHKANEYPKYASVAGTLFRLALTIGTFMGGYLYVISFRLPYLLMGVSMLATLPFMMLITEPRRKKGSPSFISFVHHTKKGAKELIKDNRMTKLTIFYSLIASISWMCLTYFNQPFAVNVGYGNIEQSWLFGTLYLLVSFVLYLLARYVNSINESWIFIAFPLMLGLALIPGLIANKLVAALMLFWVILIGSGRFVFLDSLVHREFSSQYRASAASTINMLISIMYIVFVALTGKMLALYGTQIIFTILGIITLTTTLPLGINLAKEKIAI